MWLHDVIAIRFNGRDEYEVLQQVVNITFHQTSLNAVGITGFLSPKTVSVLQPLARHKGMALVTATEHFIPGDSNAFLTLNSPSAVVSVLFSFTERMN